MGGVIVALLLINYFSVRAYWIKNFEMTVLRRSPAVFSNLPTFFYMVVQRCWVWEENYFLPDIDSLRIE